MPAEYFSRIKDLNPGYFAVVAALGPELNKTIAPTIANYAAAVNETVQNATPVITTYATQAATKATLAVAEKGPSPFADVLVALIGLGAVAFLVVRKH